MDFNTPDVVILNALPKSVTVKAFGNYFTFKPGQIKVMRAEIGSWLEQQKGHMGLISLPPEFADPSYQVDEATKDQAASILEARRHEGIQKRVRYLEAQVNNLRVGLQHDLNLADIKADINTFATDKDIEAMDELLSYQREQSDANKKRSEAARIKLRQIQSAQNAMVQKKD